VEKNKWLKDYWKKSREVEIEEIDQWLADLKATVDNTNDLVLKLGDHLNCKENKI
jgi:hypothetical protein